MAGLNLFEALSRACAERFDALFARGPVRVERIVSWGQASPPGFWYDQAEGEWVAVLTGAARLRLLDPAEEIDLAAGDWLWIAPRRRHRVEWTAPDAATVWLAVFVSDGPDGPAARP